MTEIDSPGRRPVVQLIRVVLLLGWVAWAVLAWWTAPRHSSQAQLERDRAAGAISTFVQSSGYDDRGGFWGTRPSPRSMPHGTDLVWRTGSGRTRFVRVSEPAEAEALAQRIRDTGARSWPPHLTPGQVTAVASVLMVAFLIVLLGGPAPVRGTRWFWFWISFTIFGLGVLAWMAFERPWARAPAPVDGRRRSGWVGLGYSIVGSLVVGVVGFAVGRYLPDWLVPHYY